MIAHNTTFETLVKSRDFIILDTETTGLDDYAEICQIGIIDSNGAILLDTLVKPLMPIPPAAVRVHGIRNDMVATAPTFPEIMQQIHDLLKGRNVIIYNSEYDVRLLYQSVKHSKAPEVEWHKLAKFSCAMTIYAEHWGEWNDYRQSYRWQRLTDACRQQQITDLNSAHTALGDCYLTLSLINKVWGL